MGRFRLDSIASLARQMGFAPPAKRLAQITAAEEFLLEIDPSKAYPLELVTYRITGYRPKAAPGDLLTGLALQHDLGILIERVSQTLDTATADFAEPVLQIDDLTSRFNVTSKTIQRWRRRGLPARRFVFADGRRRVGFALSSVERFLSSHGEQVSRGANCSQVGDRERDEILRRARLLATACGCCEIEISRRIARKLNRSPLTIKYTIRHHDALNPSAAIFPQAAAPIADEDRARILRAYRHGISVKRLARRVHRPRSAVYRVIVEERIARLNRRRIRFIDDPIYHEPDAELRVNELVTREEIAAEPTQEQTRVPRDLPPYLQELYRTPLLSPARERALFLKFNYHKHQFVAARRRLEPDFARAAELAALQGQLDKAVEVKNAIVRANLRLVVSIARKHLRPGLDLMELISEGNLTLMRAVESFDTHRGFRFSTYASLALMKGFARSIPLMRRGIGATSIDRTDAVAIADRAASFTRELAARDEVQRLLSRLSLREREIVQSHFGVNRSAASHDELAIRLGLSRQRVRQIEAAAMEKLRAGHSAI